MASGNITGQQGTFSSFGPKWDLAQQVLDAGDGESVLKYVEECRKFWSRREDMDAWSAAIRAGATPISARTLPTVTSLGKPAAEINVQTLSGSNTSLKELKGKTVLLYFWRTECELCRQGQATMEKLEQEHAGNSLERTGGW